MKSGSMWRRCTVHLYNYTTYISVEANCVCWKCLLCLLTHQASYVCWHFNHFVDVPQKMPTVCPQYSIALWLTALPLYFMPLSHFSAFPLLFNQVWSTKWEIQLHIFNHGIDDLDFHIGQSTFSQLAFTFGVLVIIGWCFQCDCHVNPVIQIWRKYNTQEVCLFVLFWLWLLCSLLYALYQCLPLKKIHLTGTSEGEANMWAHLLHFWLGVAGQWLTS